MMSVSLLIFSGLANATESFTTSDSRWSNDASGYPTNSIDEWVIDDGFGLNSISGRETSKLFGNDSNDNPAVLEFGAHKLCNGNHACTESRHKQFKIENANAASSKTVTLGARRYMTSVQVCLNGRNQVRNIKLKGIRISGGPMRNNGTVNTIHNAEYRRPNCSEWGRKLQCSSSKYISGIRAFRGQKGFTGLAIRCSRATPATSQSVIQSGGVLERKK